jgi:hypothetical protein
MADPKTLATQIAKLKQRFEWSWPATATAADLSLC